MELAALAPAATRPAAAQATAESEQWIEVGCIITPHGVFGEMKVQALTDAPQERLGQAGTR